MEDRISPVPREARPYQGEPAGLLTRLIANTVDALSVGAVLVVGYACFNGLLFMINPRSFQFSGASFLLSLFTALVVLVCYLTVAWSTTGRTYGDHVMGLRVVGRRGRRLRPWTAFVRAVFCVGFPIGVLWCAGNRSRRSLQDAVLRTSVIYDWTPRQAGGDSGHSPVPAAPPGRPPGTAWRRPREHRFQTTSSPNHVELVGESSGPGSGSRGRMGRSDAGPPPSVEALAASRSPRPGRCPRRVVAAAGVRVASLGFLFDHQIPPTSVRPMRVPAGMA